MLAVHSKTSSSVVPTTADTDLILRLRIALSIRRRAGWHLVRFGVQSGVVRLAGLVPTLYDRQLIAALARHVAGVLRVDDDLSVGDPSLRQHVSESEATFATGGSASRTKPPWNRFSHLPIVDESLE